MPVRLPQEKVDLILSLYRSGLSMKVTAERAGVCQASVFVNIQKAGLVGSRPREWSKEKQEKCVLLYLGGLSAAECAQYLKCYSATVRKYLLLNGVQPRTLSEVNGGERNGQWKGGRTVGRYIQIWKPDHPYATAAGYVCEHRLVMEDHLGRILLPSEVVHHRDKDKHNNSLSNLELFSSNAAHLAHELKGKVPKWTEDGKRRIREGQKNKRRSKS